MLEGKGSRDEPLRLGSQHEGCLELCALVASGSLNEAEAKKLGEHLATCVECREAICDFQSVVDGLVPELVPELSGDPPLDSLFSLDRAEATFQRRLAEEKEREQTRVLAGSFGPEVAAPRGRSFREHLYGSEAWFPLVASVLLCGTFGILSYRTGRNRGIEWARLEQANKPSAESVLAQAPTSPKADVRDRELAMRDAALADLRHEIAQKSNELARLKAVASSEQFALQASTEDKNGVTEERDRLLEQVSSDEETLRTTQERLSTLERERSDFVIHTASLEKSVTDLSRSLQRRERESAEQQDLLAKDRDIRDLIGARDLYITEIYDVGANGDTRKAAGRVFYTKGKSLVFYAYDLNQNPGVKAASTFEAWGQRGSDWHQASKLGIFYQDSSAKKSWVVKSNDRKALEQIDAVFITVEPNGGSERPTGKPLLFAYLKAAPNHP